MTGAKLLVTGTKFTAASERDELTGLLGFVSVVVNGAIRLDGITVRRTLDGRLTLSFPSRRGRDGERHAYIRPVDDAVRMAIERQVLAAIDLDEGGAR